MESRTVGPAVSTSRDSHPTMWTRAVDAELRPGVRLCAERRPLRASLLPLRAGFRCGRRGSAAPGADRRRAVALDLPAGRDVTMDGMARPNRANFRLPAAALFVPVLLFVCITPLATAGGAWLVLYIVPVIALVWVLITHTTATADRLTTYGLLGTRTMTWEELDQLELPDARWATAVAKDGRRLRLPMVRPRDVPRLVVVSGGSLRLGQPAAGDPESEQLVEPEQPVERAEPEANEQPVESEQPLENDGNPLSPVNPPR